MSLNDEEKTEEESYYRIEKTCCEDPACTGCNNAAEPVEAEQEPDEYDLEFKEDMTDPKYLEIIEFIEKAKQFGANALDLSKKGLDRIPKKLLELKHLQVNWLSLLFSNLCLIMFLIFCFFCCCCYCCFVSYSTYIWKGII